jgi:hypothetical protein
MYFGTQIWRLLFLLLAVVYKNGTDVTFIIRMFVLDVVKKTRVKTKLALILMWWQLLN